MPSGIKLSSESPLQQLERQAKRASAALRQQEALAQKPTLDTRSAKKWKTAQEVGEASPTAVSAEEEQKTFYEGVRSNSIERETGRPRSNSELQRSNAVRGLHRTPTVRKPQKPSGLRTHEVAPKK